MIKKSKILGLQVFGAVFGLLSGYMICTIGAFEELSPFNRPLYVLLGFLIGMVVLMRLVLDTVRVTDEPNLDEKC